MGVICRYMWGSYVGICGESGVIYSYMWGSYVGICGESCKKNIL